MRLALGRRLLALVVLRWLALVVTVRLEVLVWLEEWLVELVGLVGLDLAVLGRPMELVWLALVVTVVLAVLGLAV